MSFLKSMKKPIAVFIILAFAYSISWASVHAAMVSTDEIIKQNLHNFDRERLQMLLDDSEVRKLLEAWGVDSAEAKARVDSLTDQEIEEMASLMDRMPAGGSTLGTLVGVALIVFLVLLVTDILGYTDIFPFVKKKEK
jgi:hypothetical protein